MSSSILLVLAIILSISSFAFKVTKFSLKNKQNIRLFHNNKSEKHTIDKAEAEVLQNNIVSITSIRDIKKESILLSSVLVVGSTLLIPKVTVTTTGRIFLLIRH